jgi:hypothetical protein
MVPPLITPILGSRLTRPNDLLSLLKWFGVALTILMACILAASTE